MRQYTALLLLLCCATPLFSQPISMVFDPPRELVMGGLDTLVSPEVHQARRAFDLDLDGVDETVFKLGFVPESPLSEIFVRHRISSAVDHFGSTPSSDRPRVLAYDSLHDGAFMFATDTLLDLRWASVSLDKRYIPFAIPTGPSDQHYGWLWVQWQGDRFLLHGWQLSDRINIPDTVGAPPSVVTGQAAPVFAIAGMDLGESGTSADLAVRFRITPGEFGVSEYHVFVVPASADSFDIVDALAVPSGSYTSRTPDGTDPTLAFSAGANDVFGNAILQDVLYRMYVLSIPDGIAATQASLVIGSTRTLRQRTLPARNPVLMDSLDGKNQTIGLCSLMRPSMKRISSVIGLALNPVRKRIWIQMQAFMMHHTLKPGRPKKSWSCRLTADFLFPKAPLLMPR